jgi:pyruvyl transferase EpsO
MNRTRYGAAAGEAARDRVAELRRRIDATLAAHVPTDSAVALVGFPEHANVGDHLIWLGTRTWLRRSGVRCAYAAPYGAVDAADVRRAIGPGGTVLAHGGGYLTDTWPDQLAGFTATTRSLPDLPLVVLPQSLHFADPARGEELAVTLAEHGQVTVLARDSASSERAHRIGIEDVVLCPDMAFAGLGAFEHHNRSGSGNESTVVLRRRDPEAAACGASSLSASDANDRRWTAPRLGAAAVGRVAARSAWRRFRAAAPRTVGSSRLGQGLLDLETSLSTRRGIAILGSAGLVVTDRLHAALLGFLLGREVMAVNSSTGKVHDVLGTWLADAEGLQLVSTWQEASELLGVR